MRLPPFSVILVMAFSTEKRDMLVINGNAYSGDDDSMINRSFVIRPETDVISWVTDGSGSRSGWQLCLDTPPACSDGFPVPVAGEDCPSSIENLSGCKTAALGALCIGDGKCHTRMDIDNCGQADIYRKMRPKSNGTTRPSLAESRRRRSRRRMTYSWERRRISPSPRPRPRPSPPPSPPPFAPPFAPPPPPPPSCYHRRRGKASHRRRFASDDTEDSLIIVK